MGLLIDGDSLIRTTNLPAATTLTVMGWFLFHSGPVDENWETPFYFGGAAGDTGDFLQLFGNTGGFELYNNVGGTTTGSAWETDVWHHLTMVRKGNGTGDILFYLDGVLDITHTTGVLSTGALEIGDDNFTEQIDADVAAIKVWNAVLTADEILNEMQTFLPKRWTNLNCWTPGVRDTVDFLDYSGAGNDWTENGTIAIGGGPPISWGAAVPMALEVISAVGVEHLPPDRAHTYQHQPIMAH